MPTDTCPTCRTPLERALAGEVALRCCPACLGVWCSAGRIADLEGTNRDLEPTREGEEAPERGCPECPVPLALERRPYMDGHALEVDVCATCDGVWLDAGELRQMARLRPERLAREASADTAIARAAGQIADARGHRVLRSKRAAFDLSAFCLGAVLGYLLTWMVPVALVVGLVVAWLSDRFFREVGWMRLLGPFGGFLGIFRLHKRVDI